jgi:hypothetical protein
VSSVGHSNVAELPSRQRSRLTNGSQLLPGADGRSAASRRYKELVATFSAEICRDAPLSGADLTLVRQAAALTVRSEELQAAVLRGETADDEQFTRLTNALTRTLNALRRRARPKAGPSAREQALAKYGKATAA